MFRIRTILDLLAYASALLGYFPLVPYLGQVPRYLLPAAVIFGVVADRKGYELRGRPATVVSVLFSLYYLLQFSWQDITVPAANLLMVLLAVRLASEKTVRHYLQIFALALFALASSSLFDLSAIFLIYLVVLLSIIGVALVFLTFYGADSAITFSRNGFRKLLLMTSVMLGGTFLLMLFFFIILPRTQYPLWDLFNKRGETAGLSDKVTVGRAANVGAVKNVVFRAASPRLAKDLLYWRGIVLNAYEKGTWMRLAPPSGESDLPLAKERVVQTIYPEGGNSRYLIGLNVPLQFRGIRDVTAADLVHTRTAASARKERYETVSVVSDLIRTPKGIDSSFYLAHPSSLSPRIVALGTRIAAARSAEGKILRLTEFFRQSRFFYATTGLPVSQEPLDEFLFTTRRGNCEFFASSAALILRLAGVPARLVGGYYGGDYNDMGGYYVVTEDLAHVWVEAHLPGQGWVRIDPSGWAVNGDSLTNRSSRSVLQRVRLAIDAMSYYWNVTVISYDLERQLRFFSRANVGLKRLTVPPKPSTRAVKVGAAGFAVLVAAAFLALRLGISPEKRLLKAFLRRVEKMGGAMPGQGIGLHDLAVASDCPEVKQFVALYGRVVYRDQRLSREEIRTLRRLIVAMTGRSARSGRALVDERHRS